MLQHVLLESDWWWRSQSTKALTYIHHVWKEIEKLISDIQKGKPNFTFISRVENGISFTF